VVPTRRGSKRDCPQGEQGRIFHRRPAAALRRELVAVSQDVPLNGMRVCLPRSASWVTVLELFFRQVSDPQRGLERALFVGANSQEIGAISQVPAPSLRHFGDES